jgi:hypothetical protein
LLELGPSARRFQAGARRRGFQQPVGVFS